MADEGTTVPIAWSGKMNQLEHTGTTFTLGFNWKERMGKKDKR